MPLTSALAILAACTVLLAGSGERPAAVTNVREAPSGARASSFDEHRYAVVGRVRLLLFWAGHEAIGGARMSLRRQGDDTILAFLVGSDPRRAPRQINQWSYLREEIRERDAEVVAVGSVNDANAPPDAAAGLAGSQVFEASCASIAGGRVVTRQVKVQAPQATYWMFGRLLGIVETADSWDEQRMARPDGAAAGLLSAMQRVMRAAKSDPRSLKTLPPVSYVYQNTVYDLSIRGVAWLGRTRVGARTFDRLVRTDLSVRNRKTAEITRFSITYSPEPDVSALPVQITFQPSFWLRIELRLEEAADVPPDQAVDEAVLSRMRALCPVSGR
jgi:hypothetical protein